MGVGLWIVCGLAAGFLARIVPLGRGKRLWLELGVAVLAAFLLGTLATALDFGGWNELEWRAAVFAFLGALAAVGITRAL